MNAMTIQRFDNDVDDTEDLPSANIRYSIDQLTFRDRIKNAARVGIGALIIGMGCLSEIAIAETDPHLGRPNNEPLQIQLKQAPAPPPAPPAERGLNLAMEKGDLWA